MKKAIISILVFLAVLTIFALYCQFPERHTELRTSTALRNPASALANRGVTSSPDLFTPWWPDLFVIREIDIPLVKQRMAERKEKVGYVPKSFNEMIDDYEILKLLPAEELEALNAIRGKGAWPRARVEKRERVRHVISLDLSGRSDRIDGPSLRQDLSTGIKDDVMPFLASFKRIEAVFLFDTDIGDEGLAHLVELEHLKCIVLPRMTTDVGLANLSKARSVSLLSLVGVHGVRGEGFADWSNHPSLTTVRLGGREQDAEKIKSLLSGAPKIKHLWHNGVDLLAAP